MKMPNIAVMRKEEAECGSLRATERRIEMQCRSTIESLEDIKAQYRGTIESLEEQLKTSKECYNNVTFEVSKVKR